MGIQDLRSKLCSRLFNIFYLSLLLIVAASMLHYIIGSHYSFMSCIGIIASLTVAGFVIKRRIFLIPVALCIVSPFLTCALGYIVEVWVLSQYLVILLLLVAPEFWEIRHKQTDDAILKIVPDLYGMFLGSIESERNSDKD